MTFDRVFAALFALVVAIAVLGYIDVIGPTAMTVITIVIAAGLISFLLIISGGQAKTGVLVLLLVAAQGVTPQLAPERATVEFYSAAAQVIPVLLLVLALEVRLFRLRGLAPLERIPNENRIKHFTRRLGADATVPVTAGVLFITLFGLVAGELQALNSLAAEYPEQDSPETVYTAVAVGLVIVAFLALAGAPGDRAPEDLSG